MTNIKDIKDFGTFQITRTLL